MQTTSIAVYFLHGLAYFTMGTALIPALRRPSKIPIIKALPWLAAFGIMHGVYEWTEMILFMKPFERLPSTSLPFNVFHLWLLAGSFGMLFMFGVELIGKFLERGQVLKQVPGLVFVFWALIAFDAGAHSDLQSLHEIGSATARLLLCLPGAILAGAGFFMQCRLLQGQSFNRPAKHLLAASILMLGYALSGGLIDSKASFWPANVLNKEAFLAVVGVPANVFKAILAVFLATAVLLSIRVFDEEERRLVEQHAEEYKIFEEISTAIAKHKKVRDIAPHILTELMKVLPIKAGAIFITERDGHRLWLAASEGLSSSYVSKQGNEGVKVGTGLVGGVAATQEAVVGSVGLNAEISEMMVVPSRYGYFALVPITSKDECFGVVLGVTSVFDVLSEEDMSVLAAAANHMGVSMENSYLEEQRRIAYILQESLLSAPPEIPGYSMGIKFKSETKNMLVGGDFYDFIELDQDRFGVVVGDVSGKGLKAAKLTAAAKHTIRAYLLESASPGDALSRSNKALCRTTKHGEFVSALVFFLEPDGGFIYSLAGHPPPLHFGEVLKFLREGSGTPLGAFSDAVYSDAKGRLEPEDFLVLYTDGLTDARNGALFLGEEGVRAAVASAKWLSAQDLAEQLVATAAAFSSSKLHDDIMVVAIHRTNQRSGGPPSKTTVESLIV